MKTILVRSAAIVFLAAAAAFSQTGKVLPSAADGFDGAKLFGKWYEIARLPNPFEEGLIRVTSTYSPKPDGQIEVRNQGVKDGQPQDIRGRAWTPDPKNPAQMKLSFFLWFASDYVVIDFDRESYAWMVLRGGSLDRLWVFSRQSAMDPGVYNAILDRARNAGFDLTRLIRVPQE